MEDYRPDPEKLAEVVDLSWKLASKLEAEGREVEAQYHAANAEYCAALIEFERCDRELGNGHRDTDAAGWAVQCADVNLRYAKIDLDEFQKSGKVPEWFQKTLDIPAPSEEM